MGVQKVDSRIFDQTGSIEQNTITDDGRGADLDSWAVLYSGVRSKRMNPLKTDGLETYELDQQVSKLKASWLIRNSTARTITAVNMAYVVGGEHHMITAVRPFKGSRNLLVLDTIHRDNEAQD